MRLIILLPFKAVRGWIELIIPDLFFVSLIVFLRQQTAHEHRADNEYRGSYISGYRFKHRFSPEKSSASNRRHYYYFSAAGLYKW